MNFSLSLNVLPFSDPPFNLLHSHPSIALLSTCNNLQTFKQIHCHFIKEMREAKIDPNSSTMLSVLSACGQSGLLELGNWVHSWIEENGLGSNLRLLNGLIDMYAKCGELGNAETLFDGIETKNVVSWNVKYKEALDLFRKMLQSNVEPNEVTLLNVLPACAHLGALGLGKWIHAFIDNNKEGLASVAVWTSLIDMYTKCGNIEAAKEIFDGMNTKSLNAMISGFANSALDLFSRMTNEGFKPDAITFVGVL